MARNKALQVTDTPLIRQRLAGIAQREGISVPQVVRELIRAGLDEREEASKRLSSASAE